MKLIEELDTSTKKDIIIEGLMRSKGVYLLVSKPKVGKSMLALQLSYCLTYGIPFLGRKVIASPVLYISTESDFGQLKQRYETLELKPKKDSLYVIDRNGKPNISIFDHEWEIADFAGDKTTPKLVIMDMLKDIDLGISYDINDFQDIAQKLMPKLRELCEKYNISILFTHHLNKRNETLGSTAFDACIDGKITLFENKYDHNHLTMKVINRDFAGFDVELKRNQNQSFKISNPIEDDEIDENLMFFIKYASQKKEFDFTCTEIINDAKLKTTALRFGRLLNANMELLNKEGVYLTKDRKSDKRNYHCIYEEPTIEDDE